MPRPGESVLLTATATATVTGTTSAIEIFDQTTGALAGACMQSSRCLVNYTASAGMHSFIAFITPPTTSVPSADKSTASNAIRVSWLGVTIKTGPPSIVGPGKPVSLTATATVDMGALGYVLLFWDSTTGKRLTFCGSGATCSTTLTEPDSGSHDITAVVADKISATPSSGAAAVSDKVSPTWLSVVTAASTTTMRSAGTAYLSATANADLTDTPWSIGIYDQAGRLVGKPCKTGRVCSVQVTIGDGTAPFYSAVIGATPPSNDSTTAERLLHNLGPNAPLVNIQARSAAVQPSRLLWGVDSCKPSTTDAAGSDGLYPQVSSSLGAPDFWGRYLTTTPNCPGISNAEIASAASHHMGILPIYNEYNCSTVSGYDVGRAYAADASSAGEYLGIRKGVVLVIDIEPPGPWCSGAVDAAFIQGWYDGIIAGGYAPGFYGDGTATSTFGSAWCDAISSRPEVANGSYLWSFEPSLTASYTKALSPDWQPNQVGCAGNMAAWQYELSSGGTPDVDHDEALSELPLWYP